MEEKTPLEKLEYEMPTAIRETNKSTRVEGNAINTYIYREFLKAPKVQGPLEQLLRDKLIEAVRTEDCEVLFRVVERVPDSK